MSKRKEKIEKLTKKQKEIGIIVNNLIEEYDYKKYDYNSSRTDLKYIVGKGNATCGYVRQPIAYNLDDGLYAGYCSLCNDLCYKQLYNDEKECSVYKEKFGG